MFMGFFRNLILLSALLLLALGGYLFFVSSEAPNFFLFGDLKTNALVLFLLLCLPLIGSVGASSEMWSQTYGGEFIDHATSLVETSDGGYALAGRTNSFGAGSYDCWLVKIDANGNMQWNQTYGGEGWDEAYSLVESSDGGFALAGRTNSFGAGNYDFWLVKTDAYGNMVWNQTYGGTENDCAYSLTMTSDGGFALAGKTKSFGAGEYDDILLVKTDEFGIIPEFPSWTPLLIMLFAVTIIAVIYKRKIKSRGNLK